MQKYLHRLTSLSAMCLAAFLGVSCPISAYAEVCGNPGFVEVCIPDAELARKIAVYHERDIGRNAVPDYAEGSREAQIKREWNAFLVEHYDGGLAAVPAIVTIRRSEDGVVTITTHEDRLRALLKESAYAETRTLGDRSSVRRPLSDKELEEFVGLMTGKFKEKIEGLQRQTLPYLVDLMASELAFKQAARNAAIHVHFIKDSPNILYNGTLDAGRSFFDHAEEDRKYLYLHEMMHLEIMRMVPLLMAVSKLGPTILGEAKSKPGSADLVTMQCAMTEMLSSTRLGKIFELMVDASSIYYAHTRGWRVDRYAHLYRQEPDANPFRAAFIDYAIKHVADIDAGQGDGSPNAMQIEFFLKLLPFIDDVLTRMLRASWGELSPAAKNELYAEVNEARNALDIKVLEKKFQHYMNHYMNNDCKQ